MIYVLIVGFLLLAFGALNLVFAFLPAPAALEPMLGAAGRRIRFIVSFFPEHKQLFMARLLSGISLMLAGGFAVVIAATRLFIS
jgi:hypothetical protein